MTNIAAAPRKHPLWDLLTTLILIGILLLVLAPAASGMGTMMLLGASACEYNECNDDAFALALFLGIVGPWLVAVPLSIVGGGLLLLKVISFWVPTLGMAGVAVVEGLAWVAAGEVM
ncbi:hypothetical protein HQQ81_05215 [Microbacteriaceae bacterium VKM Ac-2854]|nr:hypothetical protein [Microbacteriaceae bacterium VKM Ac-2854]